MDLASYTDPFEYPDWRASRVKSLLTDGKTPTQQDDKYIHRGFRFAKALEECDGSDTSRYAITLKYKDIAKAVGLHNNASNRKYFLEALCLCRDASEEHIAEYMGETPVMVKYYGKLYFDVRDKFDNVGYLCSRILEPAVVKALKDFKDANIAWKLAGLFGGYDAVRACWELCEASPKVRNYYRNAGMTALFKDFGIGTHLRPVNVYNTEIIAEHVLKFAEIEVKSQALIGNRQSEERVDMLREIMGSIKFFIADPRAPNEAREPRLFEKVDPALLAEMSEVTGD